MHIIIVGAGRIGSSLARWLVSAGHETAVVDWDRSRCAALDEALGSVSVIGDGTDAGVLAKVGINRALSAPIERNLKCIARRHVRAVRNRIAQQLHRITKLHLKRDNVGRQLCR